MQPEMSQPQAPHKLRALIDVQAVGDTTIIPGVPGTAIRIYKVVLTAGGAAVITLKEGQRDNNGELRVANQGNIVLMFESDMPLAFPEGQPLVLNLTETIRVTGVCRVYADAVTGEVARLILFRGRAIRYW